MPRNTMKDAFVVRLGKIDHMLVFANDLRNDSFAITKSMIAIVDINLEACNRLDLVPRAGIVELVSQLHGSDLGDDFFADISLAIDRNRSVKHVGITQVRVKVSCFILIAETNQFVA
ncbi:hypothetical protein Plhal703r1_c25g0106071 [Plasmopara halstedii]